MADDQGDIKSISISVTADTKSASTKLANLVKKLSAIQENLSEISGIASDAAKATTDALVSAEKTAAEKVRQTIVKEGEKTQKVREAVARKSATVNAPTGAVKNAIKKEREAAAWRRNVVKAPTGVIGAKMSNLGKEKEQYEYNKKVKELSDQLEKVFSNIEKSSSSTTAAKNGMDSLAGAIKKVGKALDTTIKYVTKFSIALGKLSAKVSVATLKAVATACEKLGSAIGSAAKQGAKLAVSLALSPYKKLAASVKNVTAKFANFFSSLKRIAFYRAIRWALKEITQAFQEGTANLYQYSKLIDGQFAKSMDMLATSALYVKDSLAAMVSPLINNLAPAIDMITDKFVDLLNTVNEALAAMTGQDTWTAALKYPVEYAETADDASKSAKKLRNTLLGFDEINRLDDKNKGKRSSGNDTLDYLKMFEERKTNTKIKSFFRTLKDAFKAGDMTDIGQSIGNAIIGGLDKIPWSTIENRIKKNASTVATFLNGLINVDGLGTKLGESIAKAFNVAVAKMNTFYNTVNWEGVGTFLANGINGIVKTFDIQALGKNLAGIINAAAKAISGFSNNVKWSEIGTFLANGIKSVIDNFDIVGLANSIVSLFSGAVTGINALINNVPWTKLGAFLASGVNTIITNFDTKKLGEAIGGLFKKAIDGIGSFASKVEWGKLGTFLANGINGIFTSFKTDPPIGQSIAKILNGGVTAIGKFVNDVKWADIGTFLGDNITEFLKTFSITDLGKTIAGVINKGFELLGNFVSSVDWSYVGTFLSDGINGFLDDIEAKKIGEAISKSIVNCIIAAREFFKKTDFEKLGEKIGEFLNGLDWKSILSNLGGLIIDAIVASLKALWGLWKENPLLGTALAVGLGNVITTAIGLPKVTTMIGNAVSSAITSGVTGATAAGGSLLGGAALPVMLVGVAAAAAAIIWKMQDNEQSKHLGALEPYAGALQDQMYDPETYQNRMYNLKLGRDVNTPLTDSEKAVAALTSGQKTTKYSPISLEDMPKPKTYDDTWNEYLKGIFANTDTIAASTKDSKDKLKGIKEYISNIKDYVGSIPTSMGSSGFQKESNKPNLSKAAGGGTFTTGSVFLAGEAGAEIVASQGNRTTVHNRDQIAESVAIGNEEGNSLLRDLVNIGNKLLAKS